MNLPDNHHAIMPYLMLNNALGFIEFTTNVFNAKLNLSMHELREDQKSVKHSEIMIGDSTIMFSDATEQWKEATANLFIYVPDADEAYKKAIDLGATTIMELSDQNYGRTCGVKDPFGNVWWITSVH